MMYIYHDNACAEIDPEYGAISLNFKGDDHEVISECIPIYNDEKKLFTS